MSSNTSLFFQIATGLIPLLLVAGGLTGIAGHLDQANSHVQWAVRIFLVLLVSGVVLGEFFAISEAVSSDFSPSPFHEVFVAEVLAIETVVLAAAFLLPWFGGLRPGTRGRLAWLGTAAAGAVVVFLGTPMLVDAVDTAANRRDAAIGHCVRSFQLEYAAADFTAWDELDRLDARRIALSMRRARFEQRKKSWSAKRVREERAEIDYERLRIDRLAGSATAYFRAASGLIHLDKPRDLEEIVSGLTGC